MLCGSPASTVVDPFPGLQVPPWSHLPGTRIVVPDRIERRPDRESGLTEDVVEVVLVVVEDPVLFTVAKVEDWRIGSAVDVGDGKIWILESEWSRRIAEGKRCPCHSRSVPTPRTRLPKALEACASSRYHFERRPRRLVYRSFGRAERMPARSN